MGDCCALTIVSEGMCRDTRPMHLARIRTLGMLSENVRAKIYRSFSTRSYAVQSNPELLTKVNASPLE
jgi:hypothetical protein